MLAMAMVAWCSVVEIDLSEVSMVRGRFGAGLGLGWKLREAWVWLDSWLMLSSSIVVARLVESSVGTPVGRVGVVNVSGGSREWSIGRSVGEWNSRGWSVGRKSYESIGVRDCSLMRRDAAWRLRMTKGSRVLVSKSVRSRGVVVGVPMS